MFVVFTTKVLSRYILHDTLMGRIDAQPSLFVELSITINTMLNLDGHSDGDFKSKLWTILSNFTDLGINYPLSVFEGIKYLLKYTHSCEVQIRVYMRYMTNFPIVKKAEL